MTIEAIFDLGKLIVIVAGLYAAFALYVVHRRPGWTLAFERRRLALLWALLVMAAGVKVTEDVLGGESGPVDRAVLIFVRDIVPDALHPVFAVITLSGSAAMLVPLTLLAISLGDEFNRGR